MGSVNRFAVRDVVWFRVENEAAAGDVRRAVARISGDLGFAEHRVAEIAVASKELAMNAHIHGVASWIVVRHRCTPDQPTVEVLVIDSGPGLADVDGVMRDGVSSAGTLGIGLGAVTRIANRFEMFSEPNRGTVTVAAFCSSSAAFVPAPVVDGVTRPITGETVCGDAWAAEQVGDFVGIIVADGLGHGSLAASASQLAVEEFLVDPARSPSAILHAAHQRLVGTRGAAISVVQINMTSGDVRFAGIGNIAGRIVHESRTSGMTAQPGIVGQHMRNVRDIALRAVPGDLVILHSDGLTSKWDLSTYPGLAMQSRDVVGAVLLRDAGLRQDDASVVVLRMP